jgi:hypothetical protein
VAADNPRIEALRRRVDKAPASIAFAQLAEEYRRAGDLQEAVRVCRSGLEHHPTYISARVTLGRALWQLQQLDQAQAEFEQALLVAPDNLVALRGMAEIYQLRGEAPPDMSALAQLIQPPPIAVTPPPMPVAPPPIPVAPPPVDVGSRAVETAPPPPLPPPPPQAPEPVEEPPEEVLDLPLTIAAPAAAAEIDADLDADIPLDLDAAPTAPEPVVDPEPVAEVAAPEPAAELEPAPPAPEPPAIDLAAAMAAFNEAFGGQHTAGADARPEAEPAAIGEPAPAVDVPAPAIELEAPPVIDAASALDDLFPSAPAPVAQIDPEPPVEAAPEPAFEAAPDPQPAKDPFLADLEGWLSAIETDRDERETS